MALLGGSKPLAGLDIGSSSVKIVQLKETGKGYRLVNMAVRSLPQEVIVDGAIMDAGVISDTIRDMIREMKLKVKDVAVSVSGHSVIIKKIKVQEMTEEELENIDIEQNSEDGTVIGSKLHSLIAKTASNPILYGYFQKLKDLSALTRNISKRSVEIEKKSKDEHIELIRALIDRDENSSETCMRNHLRGTCQRIVETFISELKGEMKYITEKP